MVTSALGGDDSAAERLDLCRESVEPKKFDVETEEREGFFREKSAECFDDWQWCSGRIVGGGRRNSL